MITENLSTLKINKMTQEQYDRERDADNISTTELYLTPVGDHVIDQGTLTNTNGTWTYRKWANGTLECWGVLTSSITAVVKGFGGNTNVTTCYGSIYFPVTFEAIPVVNYNLYGNSSYEFSGKANVGKTSFYWYGLSNATYVVGNGVTIFAHVIGKWK